MQYAAKLSPRAVMSSGRGSSSAGLTVTAIRDGGQWALEAGALVLADGVYVLSPPVFRLTAYPDWQTSFEPMPCQ